MPIDKKLLYETLGKNIELKRKALGILQQDLAKSIGKERTSVSNIESGKQKPPIETVYEICEYLKLDLLDLLPEISAIQVKSEKVFLPTKTKNTSYVDIPLSERNEE